MSENIIKRLNKDIEINGKLLDVVTKQLMKGKRYFGSSGASLTHQIYNPKYRDKGINTSLAKVGLNGEHKTTKALKKWIQDKPEIILVDSVHLDGVGLEEVIDEEEGTLDSGDTDHVLIIGKTIIIIDSKAWKKKASYSVNEKGVILRTKKEFPGGNVRMNQAKYLWNDYFSKYDIDVQGIIVITSDEVWVVRDRVWWQQAFKLTNFKDFYMWLDKAYSYINDKDKNYIYTDLISEIVSMCIKPYNVAKELMPNAYKLIENLNNKEK